jgi:hypothetical protein
MLTYWEDPSYKNDPEDFDEILTIRLKSVKQIPDLIAARPSNCTMISTEYSGDHRKNGKITKPENSKRFKEYWRKGDIVALPRPKICPLCGKEWQQ